MNDTRKPVVYIPQEPAKKDPVTKQWISKGLNIQDALRYGELYFIWQPGASIHARAPVERRALQIADQYDDAIDYVAATGSPSLMMALGWAIGMKGKMMRVLEWDKRMARYYSTTGDVNDDSGERSSE